MSSNNRIKDIDDLIKDLNNLTSDLTEQILETKDELLKEVTKTHKQERDPFGKAWIPREQEQLWPILNKSGNLLNSYKAFKKDKNKIVITNEAEYAAAQDFKRKLLPETDIPDSWFQEIEKAIDEYIKNFNKG